MAVLSAPTNTPTLDGATAVCVSDDATGTVYLSVRTDRAWYSVANGDSQGLADADKAVIIAGTTDANIVFAANQAASLDPEQLIDGLAARLDPAEPYYCGWVQEFNDGTYSSVLTDISDWTFARALNQTGLTADRKLNVSSTDNVPAYEGGEGVVLESGTTNLVDPRFDQGASPGRTVRMGPRYFGDMHFTRWQSNDDSPGYRRLSYTVSTTVGQDYCQSALVIPEEHSQCTLFIYDGANVGRVQYELDNLIPQFTIGGRYGVIPMGNAYLLYLVGTPTATTTTFYINMDKYSATATVPVGDGMMFGGFQVELGAFPSSRVIAAAANAVRNTTQTTQTLASMGLPNLANDISGQLIVKTTMHSAVVSGDRPLLTLGTGDNKAEITINQGTVTLTKTVGGTPGTPAQITGLVYEENQSINLRWRIASTGVKLWANSATATSADTANFAADLTTVSLDSGQVTAKQIALYDTALDDTAIEALPSGRAYYVSLAGNDANDGTSDSDAFETIAHINSLTLNPGDSVYFRSGDTFYGQLLITDSGTAVNPITIGAYGLGQSTPGDGSRPIIDRSALYTGWTSYSDSGGVKIWIGNGSEIGAGIRPRGMTANGVRVPSVYNSTLPKTEAVMPYDETMHNDGTDNFYYRSDAGTPVATYLGQYESAITVTGSYVTVENIVFQGGSAALKSQDRQTLCAAAGTATDITFRYCIARQTNSVGISSGNTNSRTTICGCIAYDVGTTGIYGTGYSDTIVDNTVYDIAQYEGDIEGDRGGIGAQYGSGPKIITGNRIYNIGRPDNAVDFHISCFDMTSEYTITHNNLFDSHCGGIQIHHTTLNEDAHLVAFNVIRNTGKSTNSGHTSGKLAAIRVLNCINTRIFNNTISDVGSQGIMMRYRADNVQIKNNIIEETGGYLLYVYLGTTVVANDFDFNNYYRTDFISAWSYDGSQYDSLLEYQTGKSQEASSIDTDPVFEQLAPVTNWDVNIQVTSPAKDVGTDWWSPDPAPTDMSGNTVVDCMGAFEQ